MKRSFQTMLIISTLVMGAILLQTKYKVQEKARALRAVAAQIHKDKETLRVLRAEWAYKTSPMKLQDQSLEYFALMPIAPTQVVGWVTDIPIRADDASPVNGDVSVLLPRNTEARHKALPKVAGQKVARQPVIYSADLKRITPMPAPASATTTTERSQ